MASLKRTLVRPLHVAALATGTSTWLARRRSGRRIVMLHGVGDDELSATAFETAMAWLAERFTVVPLDDMVRALAEGAPARRGGEVSLTFDDGLRNQSEIAYPILRRLGLPATFFVCPELIENRRWLWNHEARSRLLALPGPARLAYARSCEAPSDDVEALVAQMKTLPLARRVAQEQRLRELTPDHAVTEEARQRLDPMTWGDLERLDPSLITIGSHTMSHPILPTLDDAALAHELADSRTVLEQRLRRPVELFCYPNGDNDTRVRAAVARVYRGAVTTEHGFPRPRADPHRLPRVHVTPNLALLAWRMHRPSA